MDKNRGMYFNTEAKFWSWFSSQLRKAWNVHPVKLDFIKANRKTKFINGRPIFHLQCAVCKEWFPLKNIEINHKVKCGNIKEDGYAIRMFDVGFEDLESCCKPCHSIITYSERSGLSLENARIEKEVIQFTKLTAKEQKDKLGAQSKAKNLKERKDEYRKLLKEKQ